MKKMIIAAVIIAMVSSLAGVVYAASPILKSTSSCDQQVCKVYTLGRGTLTINCAEKASSGTLTNISDFNCPTVGNQQVCTNKISGKVVNVNPYDTDLIKCQKVCGPSGGTYSFVK